MNFDRKELDKEQAKDDCIKYGTPTLGIDHSNHYKKIEVLMGIEKEKIDDTIKG